LSVDYLVYAYTDVLLRVIQLFVAFGCFTTMFTLRKDEVKLKQMRL